MEPRKHIRAQRGMAMRVWFQLVPFSKKIATLGLEPLATRPRRMCETTRLRISRRDPETLRTITVIFSVMPGCPGLAPNRYLSRVLGASGCCTWLGLVRCAYALCTLRAGAVGTGLGASGVSVCTSKSCGLRVTAPDFGVRVCRHISFWPLQVAST